MNMHSVLAHYDSLVTRVISRPSAKCDRSHFRDQSTPTSPPAVNRRVGNCHPSPAAGCNTGPMNALQDLWPASGLVVRAGDLELRWLDDELLGQVAILAGRGIHDPASMPFSVPWSRGSADDVARSVLSFQWAARPLVSPQRLRLELGVVVDGVPLGVQSASGDDWGILREVETGSWLGREHQGRGVGTRARVLILHLFFEGLRADYVRSTALADNIASNAVSSRVGYEFDGISRVAQEGTAAKLRRYRMSRERWSSLHERHAAILGAPVEMEGVEPVVALIG